MADREWLYNLAKSSYVNGQWTIDEEHTKNVILARLDESLILLFEEGRDACDIYNTYNERGKKLNLLPIRQANKHMTGLIFLDLDVAVLAVLVDNDNIIDPDFSIAIRQPIGLCLDIIDILIRE